MCSRGFPFTTCGFEPWSFQFTIGTIRFAGANFFWTVCNSSNSPFAHASHARQEHPAQVVQQVQHLEHLQHGSSVVSDRGAGHHGRRLSIAGIGSMFVYRRYVLMQGVPNVLPTALPIVSRLWQHRHIVALWAGATTLGHSPNSEVMPKIQL